MDETPAARAYRLGAAAAAFQLSPEVALAEQAAVNAAFARLTKTELVAEVLRLQAFKRAALALLRKIEWKGGCYDYEDCCPCCIGAMPQHAGGCELASFLKGG
jgi:hypothetical protein